MSKFEIKEQLEDAANHIKSLLDTLTVETEIPNSILVAVAIANSHIREALEISNE